MKTFYQATLSKPLTFKPLVVCVYIYIYRYIYIYIYMKIMWWASVADEEETLIQR